MNVLFILMRCQDAIKTFITILYKMKDKLTSNHNYFLSRL